MFITPHYHYDYLWCDSPDGMGAKTARIIKHALLIMRKYPDYKYVIDSVMSVKYFRLNYPDMWDELKQRIKEKRIELMGGMIIAPDTLMPNGESLVRQALYGTQYFKKHFDVDSKVGYFLDTFGQTFQLPQILKKSEFEFFIFVRGARNRNLPQEFIWKSPDGSKILTHWMYATYTWNPLPFTGTILPPIFPFLPIPFTMNFIPQNFKVYEVLKKLFPPFKFFVQRLNKLNIGINVLGADMSGGLNFTIKNRIPRATTKNIFILSGTDNIPPSTNILDVVEHMAPKNKKYNIKIALPSDFLNAVKKSRKKFGVVDSYEFLGYPTKFTGTYSNRIRLKQKIRHLENQFYLTELFSTFSSLFADYHYPLKEISKAIKRILCCDFHDGICGCCVDVAYDAMMKMLQLSELQFNRLLKSALYQLGTKINTSRIPKGCIPLIIFNPLSINRTEAVNIIVPEGMKKFIIKDSDGNRIPFQKDKINSFINAYIITGSDIPSIGYKLYYIERIKNLVEEDKSKDTSINFNSQGNLVEINNNRFVLTFEENKLRTITDKVHGIKLEASKYFIGDLKIINERGDSYVHGRLPKKDDTTFDNRIEVIEEGPVRTVIKIKSKLKCNKKKFFKPVNKITQFIIIYNFDIPRIDFITRFSNNIRNIRIQACFPLSFKNPKFHSEVPYGFYERDTKPRMGKSWEDEKPAFAYYDRIFPVINWMDATEKDEKGVTLINNGLPEYEIGENKDYLYLTLLTSIGNITTLAPGAIPLILGPFYNIPEAYEIAYQESHYSLFFHNGGVSTNNLAIEGLKHNIPLIATQLDNHKGEILEEQSFIIIEPSNFLIKVIKKPENGDEGLIIRVLETSGNSSNGKITLNSKIQSVELVNLLEHSIKSLKIEGETSFNFSSNPQEILTFHVKI